MTDFPLVQLPARAYFGTCESEAASRTATDTITGYRLDLPAAGACLVALFPPRGAFWGLPCRPTLELEEWEEARRVDPPFAAAVVEALREHYPSVALAPSAFVRFAALGAESDIDIGAANLAPPPPTRVQTLVLPLDELAIAAGCRRFARHVDQLGAFAMLRPPDPALSASLEWELGVDPQLRALFSADHGRGVFAAETTTSTIAALKDALQDVSADQAALWLTPLALAEEFVRFRYPIPVARPATARLPFLGKFAKSGNAGFPDDLATVALLRAKLIRKWAWPTWLHHLISATRPAMHTAMLMGRPEWAALEQEIGPILEHARQRFPVMFES